MNKLFFKVCLILFFFTFSLLLYSINDSRAIGNISDLISSSWPSVNADHTLIFMLGEDIPPSSRIIITPQDGMFTVMSGFDYTDIDLATSSSRSGPYSDRILAATSSAAADGVSVVASTSHDSIEIELNTTSGLGAGTYLQLEMGTNADFGANGDKQILNATSSGSYKINIDIYDSSNNLIDQGETLVLMVDPVKMFTKSQRIRSNGQPTGVLAYTTTQTIMSLNTNYAATCRYSTASGTPYASSTGQFGYTGGYYHSTLLTGLTTGATYTFYIRCLDDYGIPDTTDYIIYFELAAGEEDEGEETEPGVPGPGGGGAGGGGGGGFGREEGRGTGNLLPYPPLPELPGVAFSGWAYPLSQVYILKDGVQQGEVSANTGAEFGAYLPDLDQGVYTFGIWANDSDGRRSATLSTTFWLDEGTQSIVSGLILPPTIAVNSNSIQAGAALDVFGQSVPGSSVEIWLYPATEGDLNGALIIKNTATVNSEGRWSKIISTDSMNNGEYRTKAKTIIGEGQESDFGLTLNLNVGGADEQKICAGADLNGDGRVNITDFSILLYWWGSDDECADQNHDGIVNLTDFSIMMFYWTG